VAEINAPATVSQPLRSGKRLGLTDHEMQLARNATAVDPKADTSCASLSRRLQRGEISDDDSMAAKKPASTDAQIVEIIANIALISSRIISTASPGPSGFPLFAAGRRTRQRLELPVKDPARHAEGQSPKTAVKSTVVYYDECFVIPRHGLASLRRPGSVQ